MDSPYAYTGLASSGRMHDAYAGGGRSSIGKEEQLTQLVTFPRLVLLTISLRKRPPSSSSSLPRVPSSSLPLQEIRLQSKPYTSSYSNSIHHTLSNHRPSSELIDCFAFSRLDSFVDVASCLCKNLAYFRINYATIFAVVFAISIVDHRPSYPP
ncbi:hypothetical protein BHE74_00011304 [Ensete ventricosum]|nr:hypothetical protein BHE74_00011304 [Ensete ventricosum]